MTIELKFIRVHQKHFDLIPIMFFWFFFLFLKKKLPAIFCHNFVSQCSCFVYSKFCYTKVAKKGEKRNKRKMLLSWCFAVIRMSQLKEIALKAASFSSKRST